MIEREAAIKVYNEALGAKAAKGKLVRVAPEGFFEVTLEIGGKNYTCFLPIGATAILAADPEPEVVPLDVER
jgi:hypothetical protein